MLFGQDHVDSYVRSDGDEGHEWQGTTVLILTTTGRRSGESLYDFNLATYDTGDTFDQSLSKGFIEIFGMSSKIAAKRDLQQD